MTSSDREAWSFATAREPAWFGAAFARATPDVPHAYAGKRTLCGIPKRRFETYLSLFDPAEPESCPSCRERALAAPTRPCGQERLHALVLTAVAQPMREELLAALRQGATIRWWGTGPAADMVRFYARLDHVVEGRPAVVAALQVSGSVGLARVEHGGWEFIVVLPGQGPPVLARATVR